MNVLAALILLAAVKQIIGDGKTRQIENTVRFLRDARARGSQV